MPLRRAYTARIIMRLARGATASGRASRVVTRASISGKRVITAVVIVAGDDEDDDDARTRSRSLAHRRASIDIPLIHARD